MKATLRHSWYKAVGRVLAPHGNSEEQLEACMRVVGEIAELNLSREVEDFFLRAKIRPWMMDVFQLIRDKKKKDAYEQREPKGAQRRRGFEDSAAEFFDLVKNHDGTKT